MTRFRRWLRHLFSAPPLPFWTGRMDLDEEPTPPSYCQEHSTYYRGTCMQCAGRVCQRPGCGLPKQPEERTCGRERCEEWDREQHRSLRAVS